MQRNEIFTVRLCLLSFTGHQKMRMLNFSAVTFAFHFADLIIVYLGQFPLFVPVPNAVSFLYGRRDTVSRR